MPFWRLKKTRKYDISTKNLFIVGVYLLDNAYLECTLNAESTGQECLNSITQRIELVESHYFGLRYVTKKLHFHWVDLEKPLKKQLDKYAQQSGPPPNLYFGVMFYIIGAHKIPDEVARYHYYLQLKTDIIDGRLPCSTEQAIRLAAYSLQAEFGDYEPGKYTAEEYLLFPKIMMKDDSVAAELLQEAIAAHASLKGVLPVRAELQYIKEVQMIDAYGAEFYNAKDESRKDLYLGTSPAGIFARYTDGQSTVYYKWTEIAKVAQNKKTLEIDTQKSSVQFNLEDTDTAKYVSRLAQLQCQFYKSSRGNLSSSVTDVSLSDEVDIKSFIEAKQVYIPAPADSSHSSQEIGHSQITVTSNQDQRQTQETLQSSKLSLESTESHHQQFQLHPRDTSTAQLDNRRQENPTPTVSEGDPVYVNRAALLPAYRPSPDYDVIMQQRIFQQHQTQQPLHPHLDVITPHLGAAQVYVHPEGMAYSQPEISQNVTAYRNEHGNYANVEALRHHSHSIYANVFQDTYNHYSGRGGERGNNLAVHPTYSSPELNVQLTQQESFPISEFSTQEIMNYHFRPPPPYPRTSSSTPDLAVPLQSGHISDQPDLVLPNLSAEDRVELQNYIAQSRLDKPSHFHLSASAIQASGDFNPGTNRKLSNSSVFGLENQLMQIPSPAIPEDSGSILCSNVEVVHNLLNDATLSDGNLNVMNEHASQMLSEDPDDTSSEHSYSTFHAKETDESSDEESVKSKSGQLKKESSIHIRMFTPQEAPPPSKMKEEAVLRESFRRMKIAGVGCSSKDGASFRRPSLCGLKETLETSTNDSHSSIGVSQSGVGQSQIMHSAFSEGNVAIGSQDVNNKVEVEESLERLGAPPPYPGKCIPDLVCDVPAVRDNPSYLGLGKTGLNTNATQNKPVKRSSSLGMTPLTHIPVLPSQKDTLPLTNVPLLPPRKDCAQPKHNLDSSKTRTSIINLDMVVPLSKPGVVRLNKDPGVETCVLRTEDNLILPGDRENQIVSRKDCVSSGENQVPDDTGDTGSILNEYPVESDTDSDHDQSTGNSHLNMGPLKLAAMNGLTLSRSVVLSLMNDESRAPSDDRRQMLESKISEGQVYAEFEQIPRKSESLECNVALGPHNAPRNRFKDVLPYDITRVKLTPRKDNPDGYINASHLKLTANENKWLFIATQAPLANTAVDFWQMVWENSVDVIAMLTPFEESGKSKCYVYWPQESGPQHKHVYGEYEVELQFTDDSLCYLTSRISLRKMNQEHLVWHLQYTDWPDHGCPEDTYGFLGFLDEIESVARIAENESGRMQKSPVVVHCSAGVGRTGVVILTMVMKWCLEHNHNVDLPKALSGIRSQRMHMVQTMGQYRFIHDTLIQYLKNTRLI